MTNTTALDTRTAFHFGFLDDAANNERTVVELTLTVARCLETYGLSADDLLAVYDEGDSFREWCEARWDAEEANENWGRNDSYHGVVYMSGNVSVSMAVPLFECLVDAGIADPTADCSPYPAEYTAAWAFTSAEDWSVQYAKAAE